MTTERANVISVTWQPSRGREISGWQPNLDIAYSTGPVIRHTEGRIVSVDFQPTESDGEDQEVSIGVHDFGDELR